MCLLFQKSGFYHRDLKPKNIMVDDELNVYFIDFGGSFVNTGEKYEDEGKVFIKQLHTFTPLYSPPEGIINVLKFGKDINLEKHEIYAIAATFCKICDRETKNHGLGKLFGKIKNKEIVSMEEICEVKRNVYDTSFGSIELKNLLDLMLDNDPNNRPGFSECLDKLEGLNFLDWDII